ncbi:hypothetical protein LV457_03000 [Mycobacterium sp. MYCO198283]|uniref:hypothetical protein n=1 Tax=Mycobacterium sp. MYCO198283 TaxID=2883505 RepID=UPI001E64EA62|nr:hypothetical protein [Mycobacterium sp. MYCO198283]MCG5431257.1 hypothetical protein [Mycobacterium sp. MYCO198283]
MTFDSTAGGGQPIAARLKAWWLSKLDSDSVRDWIPPYCTAWLVWALFATFLFPPVPTIVATMGDAGYWAWVWTAVPANLAPIVGLRMRHGGSAIEDMSDRLLFRDWMGLIFQATGHAVCFVLMVMFQVAAWIAAWTYDGPATYAGMTIFAASMLLPWTGGTLLLSAQTVRKLQRGMQIEQQAHTAAVTR